MVEIPRFKLRHRTDLKEILPKMGVRSLFDPATADLTGISASEGLYVGMEWE